MEVVVSELEEVHAEDLDSFLKEDADTLLYSSHAYLSLLKDYLKCSIKLLLVYKNEKIIASFPLAFTSGKLGTVCNSLPFYGSNGSMTVSSSLLEADKLNCYSLLLQKALNVIKDNKSIASTFITNPLQTGSNEYLKSQFKYDFKDERIGQITYLNADKNNIEQSLLQLFDDPRPRNIRKAIKSGITVSADTIENQLKFLYDVHHANITAIGGIPKELEFFQKIGAHFNVENCKVYVGYFENRPVAALLLFYFNKTVEYFTPAVVESFRSMQPTSLIVFEAMKDAIRQGYDKWNWGGTWLSQGGVYDFKKKWGATDKRYYYYTQVYKKEIVSENKDFLISSYPNFYLVPFNQLLT